MALRRSGKVPQSTRLKASFWTSIGAAAVLMLAATTWTQLFADGAIFEQSGASARRLISDVYPDDGILTKVGGTYSEDPQKWLVVLHCIGIGYMLLGLNTVCDVYFTGALEVMVDKWEVQPDVAGATFMAAGGSAPELFTSLIGATVESDVGFSTIVGSAVFNVLFVIGLCGWFGPQSGAELSWWPLFRDCSYYVFGLLILAIFSFDGSIVLYEALILFALYIVYCIIMYFNPRLERVAKAKVDNMRKRRVVADIKKVHPAGEPAELPVVGAEGGADNALRKAGDGGADTVSAPPESTPEATPEVTATLDSSGPSPQEGEVSDAPPSCKIEVPSAAGDAEDPPKAQVPSAGDGGGDAGADSEKPAEAPTKEETGKEDGKATAEKEDKEEKEEEGKDGDDDDEDDEEWDEFIQMPAGAMDKVFWALKMPVFGPLYMLTMRPNSEKWFLVTFVQSLVWIAGFSFLLVWWVEILGDIIFAGNCSASIVMGFTILAAGTSIPDAVSSVAVAKKGQADMAVSSSIGSNIFDILVGLPIPWSVKIILSLANGTSSTVKISSPFIFFYVVLLLIMVCLTVGSIHSIGWILNRKLGLMMATLYAIFLAAALSTEFARPVFLAWGSADRLDGGCASK
uniref:Sodium/calcium exchanger membrane region domain-containing protein n=1 Tax=Zooxanthella nutricula TaxID=1333877 RepID=A0A6U9BJK6_9DINO